LGYVTYRRVRGYYSGEEDALDMRKVRGKGEGERRREREREGREGRRKTAATIPPSILTTPS
jgi:hypothetical protein